MIDSKWFCEPDSFREVFCFFYLHTTPSGEHQIIEGWKSGIGNIDSIVHHNQSSNKNEQHNINSLIPEIKVWRKKNMLVITDTEEAIPLLRTRIVAQDIDGIILSSIKTRSLEAIFNKYLSYQADANLQSWCNLLKINTQNTKETELIRMIFQKLIRLIPSEEIP